MHTGLEIGLILLLILANGAFSMSEIALISSRRARLEQRADSGSRGARTALLLTGQPNRFLSTVQIGITFVGTFAGAFGGATLAEDLAAILSPIRHIGAHSEAVAFGVVVTSIAYLSLVLGELVPKRIALASPETIASLAARPMRLLSTLAAPLVAVLSASTNLVLRLLPLQRGSEPVVTEEEIRGMIAHGARTGILHPAEREMLEGVFHLNDRYAVELMTPRNQAVWIDLDQPVEDSLRLIRESPSSCFPAFRGSPDRVQGFIETRDLIGLAARDIRLEQHLKPAIEVREHLPALRLVDLFRESKSPVALVVGEDGQPRGVVTVMGLLEAIVGDLPQAGEEYEPRVVSRADGSLLVDGRMPIGELGDRLRVGHLAPEERTYVTLGGFVMNAMGDVPSIGDAFERFGYRFEVVDMDGRRVDRVLVSRVVPGVMSREMAGEDPKSAPAEHPDL
jgi:putative hemolysin